MVAAGWTAIAVTCLESEPNSNGLNHCIIIMHSFISYPPKTPSNSTQKHPNSIVVIDKNRRKRWTYHGVDFQSWSEEKADGLGWKNWEGKWYKWRKRWESQERIWILTNRNIGRFSWLPSPFLGVNETLTNIYALPNLW